MWIKKHFCKLNRSRYFHWKKIYALFFFDWWKSLISSTIKIKADALQLIVLWSSMILFDVTFLICVVFRISQNLNIRQLGLLLNFASNFPSIYWLMMVIQFFFSISPKDFWPALFIYFISRVLTFEEHIFFLFKIKNISIRFFIIIHQLSFWI